MSSSWIENELTKACEVAKTKLEKELEDKVSFVLEICKNKDFPEDIAIAMFKECSDLEEIKYICRSYTDTEKEMLSMCPNLNDVYLEKQVLHVSSASFGKDSVGWNHNRTKEQQREHAIEQLGYSLSTMKVLEEENKSGVISLRSTVVAMLCKNIAEEFLSNNQEENVFLIKKEMDGRHALYILDYEEKTASEQIRYEATLVREKDMRKRLTTEDRDPLLTAITVALFKIGVSTPIIYDLVTQLTSTYFIDWSEFPNVVKISKSIFLKLCESSVR